MPEDDGASDGRDRGPGPIENIAIRKLDSLPRQLRLARYRTTATVHMNVPRKWAARPGFLAERGRNGRQRSRIPSRPNLCESMQEEFSQQLDNHEARLAASFPLAHPFCCRSNRPPRPRTTA